MTPDEPRPLTPEEQKKVDKAQWILYGAMVVLVVIPFIVLWLTSRNK